MNSSQTALPLTFPGSHGFAPMLKKSSTESLMNDNLTPGNSVARATSNIDDGGSSELTARNRKHGTPCLLTRDGRITLARRIPP